MTLFVFEGPRKAGKTTLIQRANEEFRLPAWNRPPAVEAFKMFEGHYLELSLDELSLMMTIDWTRNDLIIDRHPHVSEWVYRQLRDPAKGDKVQVYGIDSTFSTDTPVDLARSTNIFPGTVFIYAYRKMDSEEALLYDTAFAELRKKCPVLFIDTDNSSLEVNVEHVKQFLMTWSGKHGRRHYM